MPTAIYGLMAEFKQADEVVAAAEATREAGYKRMDAYTPFPVHGLHEAIGFHDNRLPWMIFLAGCTGCVFGFAFQWYLNVIDYPWNVGGRPYNSWPAFIPVTFECTILFSALTAVFGMLALNGFPRPYHPVFNAPRFELATQDRFFLCIEASDPLFNVERTQQFLENLGAVTVNIVEP